VQQERRKYLLRAASGPWLLKFAGLGSDGLEKLARAHALHRAGFTPQPLAYRHGFLVERWLDEARPVDLAEVDRAQLVETVARYLAFRARAFPVAQHDGASIEKLLAMARRNTELALGPENATAVERWTSEVSRLQNAVFRVDTDNRLQSWEWVVTPDGRIMKTDALDHSAAHDLVGCQDIAWDVAGATVELALDDSEQAQGMQRVARESGRAVHPGLLAFSRIAYLAFQVGAQHIAAQALVGWPAEAERLRRAETRYRDALARALSMG
jgi:hypothetical protein